VESLTPKQSLWNYLVLLAFAILSVVGSLHHEMWLDEVNCWLTAKESHSISALFANCHNSGHPFLWNILLYVITRFTDNLFSMQVLHALISITAAYIFIIYSPFSLLQKVLIVFGYYFLFEYNLISRDYSLSWLLLALFCMLFNKNQKNYVLLSLILALLVNTHLFSLLLSIPLFLILMLNYAKQKGLKRQTGLLCLAIFLTGAFLGVISIIPTQRTYILEYATLDFFSHIRLTKTFSFFPIGFFPLLTFSQFDFWNSNYFTENSNLVANVLPWICFVAPLLFLYPNKRWLLFFYVSTLSIMAAVYYLNLHYGTRYKGFCFLIFLSALWLSKTEKTRNNSAPLFITILTNAFLYSVLIFQFIGGIYAYSMDLRFPFSEGKETADYIKSQLPENSPVFVIPMQVGPSISAYLGRKVFYPDRDTYGSSMEWTLYKEISCKDAFDNIVKIIDSLKSNTFALVLPTFDNNLVQYQALANKYFNSTRYHFNSPKTFNHGLVNGENYFVYIVQRNNR
jgi:hypothetical protein